jgi:hypothetical protein
MTALLGFLALFALAFVGLPLGLDGRRRHARLRRLPRPAGAAIASQQVVDTGIGYELSVIPLFVLMGSFIFKAGLADELFSTAQLARQPARRPRTCLARRLRGVRRGAAARSRRHDDDARGRARDAPPRLRPGFAGATIAAGGTLGI